MPEHERTNDAKILAEIAAIKDKLDDKFSSNEREHSDILTQVIKTNGRVRNLEMWKGFIMGGLTVITLLILPMVFTVLKFWFDNIAKGGR